MKKKVFVILLGLLIAVSCSGLAACSKELALSSFAVKEGTLKTEYTVGETLNLDGAKISKTMTDGSVAEESITANMVSGFSTENSGTRAMLISYQGQMIAVNYNVTTPETPTINSIALKTCAFTKTYLLGSQLSLNNAKLVAQLSDGTSDEVAITADMVSGFASSAVGNGIMLISYQGKVCMFNYEILAVQKTLEMPQLSINGNVLSWQKQDYADGYEIYLNKNLISTVTDSYYNIPIL